MTTIHYDALKLLVARVDAILADLTPGSWLVPAGADKTNALISALNEAKATLELRVFELVVPDEIAAIRQRVADGKLDLRTVGVLLDGKFDQDLPARILAAAAAAGALARTLQMAAENMDVASGILGAASAAAHADLNGVMADDEDGSEGGPGAEGPRAEGQS